MPAVKKQQKSEQTCSKRTAHAHNPCVALQIVHRFIDVHISLIKEVILVIHNHWNTLTVSITVGVFKMLRS